MVQDPSLCITNELLLEIAQFETQIFLSVPSYSIYFSREYILFSLDKLETPVKTISSLVVNVLAVRL